MQFIEPEALGDLPTFESTFSLVAECVKHFDWPEIGVLQFETLDGFRYQSGEIS